MFAIDFDGTIADTNSLKSLWILEHLGALIPRRAQILHPIRFMSVYPRGLLG